MCIASITVMLICEFNIQNLWWLFACVPEGAPLSPLRVDEELLSPQHSQQQQVYRSLVLKDILESERAHLADLQSLLASHLGALRKSDVWVSYAGGSWTTMIL